MPELLVKNAAKKPVLILDGEELVGAKQNRIVNLTILVAAEQTLHIPVSCVEAGRWARRSREFAAAGRAHYATGRARKLEQVSCAMHAFGTREADQGDVWQNIDAKSRRMKAGSATHAAAAMYERSRSKLDAFLEELEAVPRQAGAVFTINGSHRAPGSMCTARRRTPRGLNPGFTSSRRAKLRINRPAAIICSRARQRHIPHRERRAEPSRPSWRRGSMLRLSRTPTGPRTSGESMRNWCRSIGPRRTRPRPSGRAVGVEECREAESAHLTPAQVFLSA